MSTKTAIVAFGGNALIRDTHHQSIHDQYETASTTIPVVIDILEAGWNLVLTHGNGPQVGYILRRSELSATEMAPIPLDYAVGDTQGSIGYMFVKALHNELKRRGIKRQVVGVITHTLVDLDDHAFAHYSKPIGPMFDRRTAEDYREKLGWTIMEDSGRGWRRAVASPRPLEILELEAIRKLLGAGMIVIACGGGGIPVAIDDQGQLIGVEAVIDKDRASGLLAKGLVADLLVICTAIDKVAINFGTKDERFLDRVSPEEALRYLKQGHFGEGSMLPKVAACIDFVRAHPNAESLITSPSRVGEALRHRGGTWITYRTEAQDPSL